jgi:hypothetical protein
MVIPATLFPVAGATAQDKRPTPPSVIHQVALLSFTESFCHFTEWSMPYAYVAFAFQMDGRIRYFRTKTTCADFNDHARPIFGEQVALYGATSPFALRREDGTLYELEPWHPIRMFFNPKGYLTEYENPKYLDTRHPALVTAECRRLADVRERDLCLWYQAGLQDSHSICEEMSDWLREKCGRWVSNIKSRNINQ